MEINIYSKTHPDYKILVIHRGSDTLVDTSILTKCIPGLKLKNHETPEELQYKLKSSRASHPYKDWLVHHLAYTKPGLLLKDHEIVDKSYWSANNFKSIKVKEVASSRYEEMPITSPFLQDFVVMDVESTGLNKKLDFVIQLSAVKYVGGVQVDTFDTFVRPEGEKQVLEPLITSLTGITQEQVDGAPHFTEVWDKFLDFVGDFNLVGHNLKFDLDLLISEVERNKLEFGSYKYQDTLKLAKKLVPDLGRGGYKLEQLKKRFLSKSTAELASHNALNDCIMTGELYLHLKGVAVSGK